MADAATEACKKSRREIIGNPPFGHSFADRPKLDDRPSEKGKTNMWYAAPFRGGANGQLRTAGVSIPRPAPREAR